jgi:hypothetical protein
MDDQWVEIFKNLELTTIPIKYLHSVRITFNDNKIWDIDVKKSKLNNDNTNIEESLYKLFEEYEDTIQDIDFRLDTKKIKKDIQKKTTTFLKKRK